MPRNVSDVASKWFKTFFGGGGGWGGDCAMTLS